MKDSSFLLISVIREKTQRTKYRTASIIWFFCWLRQGRTGENFKDEISMKDHYLV